MTLDLTFIRHQLLLWFRDTDRNLPWRKKYSPYHVWISEIMLQQTQMERGVEYFNRWIKHLPDITSVANAKEEVVLKLWEGLGYYTRARNLHKAAKILVDRYNGELPEDDTLLRGLPGIGPYTATAISSIAFNHDIPVIDANVERVFARLFDIDTPLKRKDTRTKIEVFAWELLPSGKSRDFNQALMDFGGVLCTPKKPQCEICPLATECLARLREVVHDRPISKKRKKIIPIEMATGVLVHDQKLFVQKRLEKDIWGGLWEFPGGRLEENERAEEAVIREYLEETEFEVDVREKITTIIHHYTRYKVILYCYFCRLKGESTLPELHAAQEAKWIYPIELQEYGFPAGHRKLISYLERECPQMFNESD